MQTLRGSLCRPDAAPVQSMSLSIRYKSMAATYLAQIRPLVRPPCHSASKARPTDQEISRQNFLRRPRELQERGKSRQAPTNEMLVCRGFATLDTKKTGQRCAPRSFGPKAPTCIAAEQLLTWRI